MNTKTTRGQDNNVADAYSPVEQQTGQKNSSTSLEISSIKPEHPLGEVIGNYLTSLRNIGQTVNIVMPHLSNWLLGEIEKHRKEISQFLPENTNSETPQQLHIKSGNDIAKFTGAVKALSDLNVSRTLSVLARSLFMQMFCEFDAFMGILLKTIYLRNGNLLKGISREISLADLIEYESIDAATRAMLEKEIETFRRDSYVEQFAQLEKKNLAWRL